MSRRIGIPGGTVAGKVSIPEEDTRIEGRRRRGGVAGTVAVGALGLVALVALLTAGCDGDSPTSPANPPSPEPLTSEILAAMADAIQDEYHAEATYESVLLDFGSSTLPFANIVTAERQHSESIAKLYTNRALTSPPSEWNAGEIAPFSTLRAACVAGVEAERSNIALYDGYLSLALPLDVRTVFSNNRAASLESHLPAFETCAQAQGQ